MIALRAATVLRVDRHRRALRMNYPLWVDVVREEINAVRADQGWPPWVPPTAAQLAEADAREAAACAQAHAIAARVAAAYPAHAEFFEPQPLPPPPMEPPTDICMGASEPEMEAELCPAYQTQWGHGSLEPIAPQMEAEAYPPHHAPAQPPQQLMGAEPQPEEDAFTEVVHLSLVQACFLPLNVRPTQIGCPPPVLSIRHMSTDKKDTPKTQKKKTSKCAPAEKVGQSSHVPDAKHRRWASDLRGSHVQMHGACLRQVLGAFFICACLETFSMRR